MPRSSRRRSRGTQASGGPLRPALLRSPSQQAALSAVPETAAACLRSAGLAKWPTPPQRRSPSSPRSCCRERMDPALPVHSAGERAACSRRKNARSHWSHYSPRVAAAGCLAVCPALAGPRPAARASPPATVEYAPLRCGCCRLSAGGSAWVWWVWGAWWVRERGGRGRPRDHSHPRRSRTMRSGLQPGGLGHGRGRPCRRAGSRRAQTATSALVARGGRGGRRGAAVLARRVSALPVEGEYAAYAFENSVAWASCGELNPHTTRQSDTSRTANVYRSRRVGGAGGEQRTGRTAEGQKEARDMRMGRPGACSDLNRRHI